jgi:hypothetical protein
VQKLRTSLRFDVRINIFLPDGMRHFILLRLARQKLHCHGLNVKKKSSEEKFARCVSKAKQAVLSLSGPCRHTGGAERYSCDRS